MGDKIVLDPSVGWGDRRIGDDVENLIVRVPKPYICDDEDFSLYLGITNYSMDFDGDASFIPKELDPNYFNDRHIFCLICNELHETSEYFSHKLSDNLNGQLGPLEKIIQFTLDSESISEKDMKKIIGTENLDIITMGLNKIKSITPKILLSIIRTENIKVINLIIDKVSLDEILCIFAYYINTDIVLFAFFENVLNTRIHFDLRIIINL